jgi:hypothetical protein
MTIVNERQWPDGSRITTLDNGQKVETWYHQLHGAWAVEIKDSSGFQQSYECSITLDGARLLHDATVERLMLAERSAFAQ